MRKWILLISLLMVAGLCSLYATSLMTEDFATPTFTAGSAVSGINGWTTHSGGTTNPWLSTTGNLTYANYSATGVGLQCQTTTSTGQDINKTFTAVTSGSVYSAFLINVSSFPNANADYEISLGTGSSTFYGRIFFKRDATLTNKYTVGLSKYTGTAVYTTATYDTGTTYLFILKYTYVASTTNDVAYLWINPPTPGTETAPTLTSTDAGADATTLSAFFLRQGSNTPPCIIDAIKVGTAWNDVYPSSFTGLIELNKASLTFSTPSGTPSAGQDYEVTSTGTFTTDIRIKAPLHYQVKYSESSTWADSVDVTPPGTQAISVRYNPVAPGTENRLVTNVAGGAAEVDLPVYGTATTAATITVNPTSRTFSTPAGTTSSYQSYTLTGASLTDSITVTAPTGYEISKLTTGPWVSTFKVPPTYDGLLYVQFKPLGYGTNDGLVSHTANSVTTNLNVYGTGTSSPMNIEVGSTITENFNAIGVAAIATLGSGWKVDKNTTVRTVGTYSAAVSATELRAGNLMSSSAQNGIYNYGAGDAATATDRALGFVSSGSATKSGNIYAMLTNTGASAITAFDISFNAEKYRKGINSAGSRIQMYYSLNGTSWNDAGTDFLASWPAADDTTYGYVSAPGATIPVSGTLGVTVPASSALYLAWNYSVVTGTTTTYVQGLGIDDVSITGRALTIVSLPTFDPAPGIYYSASENVTLSCLTPSSSIRYTTDGVTSPTETIGTLYTGTPINVSSTTTIKAIAYRATWTSSDVATATYTFPINVASIAALRAAAPAYNGLSNDGTTLYRLTSEAILTLQSTTGTTSLSKNKYIQDATGAIQIYDAAPAKMTTTYSIGNGITGILGTLTNYYGMIELKPTADAGTATNTSGYVPTPVDVTLAGLNTTYQAQLIRIKNVEIDPLVTTFTSGANITITDPTGTGLIRTAYSDLDYITTATPTDARNYTGICLQYTTTSQFVPRSLADISTSAPIAVGVEVSGNNVILTWAAVTGATSYIVEYADAPNGTYSVLTTGEFTGATTYEATGDADSYGLRFYRVIAVK